IYIGRKPLVQIVRIGLIGLIIFEIVSIFAITPNSLLLVRLLTGIFGGLVYAGALGAFSGLKNPIKAFGIYVVIYCLWSGIGLISLPTILQHFGIKGGYLLLALMGIVSLLLSPIINQLAKNIKEKSFDSLPVLLSKRTVVLALLAYFSMQMAGGTIWAYTERIGKEAGLNQEMIGFTLGTGTLVSMLGGLLVFYLGNSKGIKWPVILGLFAMAASGLLLYWSEYPFLFFFANGLLGGAWAFLIPFYQQIQAGLDVQGKVVSLGTIVNMAGRSFGPALSALLLGTAAFINVVWLAVITLLISLAFLIPLLRKQNSD
ncbi:MAG: MFS transporter, partial [Saprospiraceae bacterium]